MVVVSGMVDWYGWWVQVSRGREPEIEILGRFLKRSLWDREWVAVGETCVSGVGDWWL